MAERRRILVIDAIPEVGELLRDVFRDEGYEAVVCHEPLQALAELHAQPPHLIMLDVHLNHTMQGIDLLRAIRAAEATRATPVIVSSADAVLLHTLADELQAHGCVVIEKPFDLTMLTDTIRRLLPRDEAH